MMYAIWHGEPLYRAQYVILGGFPLDVLVAGGAGFIGSHLCARLLKDGHRVVCVDNLLTGSKRNIEDLLANAKFTFQCQDITSHFAFKVDAVFHLASPASPVGYWEYPFETIRVNTEGTMLLLQECQRNNARFLMASTSEAYGNPLVHPQTEDYWGNVNPTGPRSCYDESKRLGETITAEFHRQYDMDTRIVRIFNTYGPNSQLNDGRMIPNFIMQALSEQPVTIHGDGQQTRSICYVDDLVDGLVRAMFEPGTKGEIFNLGNPEERPVLEWAQIILQLCRSESPILFEEKRVEDPERRRPNIDKAGSLLHWEPKIKPEVGLERTINWFRAEMEHSISCLSVMGHPESL
jgi:nucleoside-diphosphate-sugar epimerase